MSVFHDLTSTSTSLEPGYTYAGFSSNLEAAMIDLDTALWNAYYYYPLQHRHRLQHLRLGLDLGAELTERILLAIIGKESTDVGALKEATAVSGHRPGYQDHGSRDPSWSSADWRGCTEGDTGNAVRDDARMEGQDR